jgi:UDP-N-acetylglucosamine 2-epimerase (non-hydrolysing)/GDP/UDP-N,N'-diacetylbacillosamine 2-epimerase (hydrolysing)
MRKILVVTGTRAEYGLLKWLIREIADDPGLVLQVAATGMHLSPEFGLTYREIEADGFMVDEKVECLLSSDTETGISKAMGLAMIGFADALTRLAPDVMVVLGDRFEILSAVVAAMNARIPVAHIHGGEATEGLVDEAIRHAVTKMAHFHFTAAEPYRRRVIQLGEDPKRVFNVGAPGLDAIRNVTLLDRRELAASLEATIGAPLFVVTYHPVTLEEQGPEVAMKALFAALDTFPDATILFTMPNADAAGRTIGSMIRAYASERRDRVVARTSLGQQRYFSALALADAVVGNSSSGIIEAPAFGVPTVNIGDRQRGRLRAASVIDCEATDERIAAAIAKALTPEMRAVAARKVSPYGHGETAVRIKETLKAVDLGAAVMKRFYDLPGEAT